MFCCPYSWLLHRESFIALFEKENTINKMFMNKKNLRYLILVLLVILVLVVVATQNKSTIKKELRDFAVEDTALVDKIFLMVLLFCVATTTNTKITNNTKIKYLRFFLFMNILLIVFSFSNKAINDSRCNNQEYGQQNIDELPG